MKCPVDGETLVITERGGVEIDYCPKCRGVWLDRGELDKIIERSAAPARAEPQEHRRERLDDRSDDRRDERPVRRYSDDDNDHRGGKRREHWLSDLFDF